MKERIRNTRLDYRQLVSTIVKNQHHVRMNMNMRNTRLDYKHLGSTIKPSASCQDEEEYEKCNIGLQGTCEHHCQVPGPCQDERMSNARLDYNNL
ncbi:hypothetical protein K492DRAFT_170597 [Lichtheimia hyalospora FSU 10163]|nr:hypothetical protein K492DRAFT_170597 [Lichtheimia hyalospora FSU 10163]